MYTLKLDIGSWALPVSGGGYILSGALKDGVTIGKKRDKDNRGVVRTEINGEFLFYNNSNREFDKLEYLKSLGYVFIKAKIYYNDAEKAYGIINLNKGTWDENKKTASIGFDIYDEYTDILLNNDIKYNICSKAYTDVYVVYHSRVYYATFECFDGGPADIEENYYPNGQPNSSGVVSNDWTYFEIIRTTPCDGGGITRVYATTYITFPYPGFAESEVFSGWYLKSGTSSEIVSNLKIPYFLKLYTVIEDLIKLTGDSITIDESTYCTYFTQENTELSKLYIADKSNVKRYEASNRALFEYITLSDLLKYLKYMFNLDWTVENNVFKLKRPESYSLPDFENYPKHDFTVILNGSNATNNQKIYEYDPSNKYRKETWNLEQSERDFFFNAVIDYRSLDENDETYDLLNFNNDIEYLITDPEDASDSGFCLVATANRSFNAQNILNQTVDGNEIVNYKLSALNMVNENHKIDRSYNKGYIDDVQQSFTKRPDKKVIFKNLPIYDIDDIDFNYLVKSDVGNLIPESIEIDMTLKEFSKFTGVF